jgi:hypothetical protein
LGGKIHGLYPGLHLTLEKQDSSIDKCVALDMRILTNETPLPGADRMLTPGYAYSYAALYDRRRLPGFASFEKHRFQHVTSCKPQGQAYNMLHGRLCHLLRIIMKKECFVLEAARCIHHMRRSGYDSGRCFTQTKHFLAKFPHDAYNTPYLQLLDEIRSCYEWIEPDLEWILGDVDEWNTEHHTVVVPPHSTASSDMDISE